MGTPESPTLRDASHVAFGLCVLAIVIAPLAIIAGAVVAAVAAPRDIPHHEWQKYLLGFAAFIWMGGMALALRHYRRSTRDWTGERRGGNMLLIVELVGAFAGHFGPMVPGWISDDVFATRLYLSSFILLLILCHIAAYAVLRYRPKAKEALVWLVVGAVAVIEIARNL